MGNSASRTGGAAKQQKQATKASYSSNGAAASPSQKKHQVKTGGQRTKPVTQKNQTADAVKAAAARRPSTSGSRAASVPERGTRKARETPQAAFVGKGDDEGEAFLSGSSFVLYEYYSYSYTASESGSSLDGAEPESRQRNAGDGKAVVPETERHTRHRLHKGPSSGGPAEKQRGGRPPRSALHSPDVSNELKERQNKVHSVRSDSSSLLALSATQQRPRLAGSSGGALPAGPQTSSLQATEEGLRTKPSTTPFSKDSRSGKSSSPLEMANRLRPPRESSSPPHQTRSPSHGDEKPHRKSLREERQTESQANKENAGNAKRRKQRHRSTPTLEFALPRAALHSSDVSPVPDESEDSDPHPLESTIPACEEDVQRLREAIMDHTTSNHGDDGMLLSDRCHPLNGTGEWPLRTVDGNTGESAEPTRLRADAVAEPRHTEGRWPPEQQELWLGESLRTPTEQGKGRRRVRGDREPPSAHVFELPTLGDDRLASSTQRGAAAVVPSQVLCSSSQEPSPPFNSSSRNETKWWNQLHTDSEGGQGGHPAKQRRSDSSELEKNIADEVKQAEGEKQVCKKGGKTVVPQKNRKEVTTPTAGMTGPPVPQPFNGPPPAKPVSINTHVASPTLLIAMGTTPRAVQSPSSGGVLLDGTAISLVPTGDTQSNEKPLAQFEMLPLTSMTSSNEAQLWGLPQDTQPAEVLLLPETLSFSTPAPAMENHFVKGGGLRGGDDDDDGDWIDVRSPSSPLWLTPFAYSSTPPTSTLSEAKWHLSPDRHPHRLHVQHLQKRCRSAVSDSSQARRQKPTEEGGSAAPKAPLAGGVWSPTLANGSADSGRSAVWTPVDALGSDEETAMTGVGLTAGMGPPYGGTSRRVAEQGRKFRLKAKSDRERSLMLRLGRKKIPHGPVRSALMLDPMLSATSTPLTMVLPSSSFVSRGDLARQIVQCKKKQPVQESLERQTPGGVRRRQSLNGAAEDAMDVQEVMDEEEEEEGEELLAQGREDDRSPTTVSTRLQEEHLGHEQGGGTPPAGAATANARPDAVSYSLGAVTHTPALLAMRRRAFTLRRKRPKHIRDSWFARLQQPELSMTSFFDDGRVTPQKSKSLKPVAAATSQVGHTNDVRTDCRWCAEEEEELGVGVSASWSHVSASPPRRGEEEDGVVEDSNVKEMLQRTESVTHTRAFLSHPREPSNVSSLYPHSGFSVPPSSTRPTAENCLSTPHSTAGEAVNHPSVDSQGTAQRPRDPRSGAHAARETSRNPSRHSSDIMTFCFSLLCSGEVTQRELIREAEAELFGELKVSFAYFRGHVAGLRRSPSPGQSSIVPLHWESRVSTSGGPSPLLLDNCTALALPGFGSETRSGMLPTTSTFTPSGTTATLLHRSNTVAAAGGPPTFTETGLQRRPLPSWEPLTDTAETDEALQHAATAAPATSSPVKGDRSVGRQNSSPGTTNAPQEGDLEPKPTPPISNAAAEGGATTGKKEEVELERRQDEPAVQRKGGAEATAPFPLRRRSPSIPEETRSVSVTAKPEGTAANRPTEGSQAIELHSVSYRAPSPISPRSPSNEPLSSPRHLPLSPRVDSFPSSAPMELLEHPAVLRGASSEVGGVGERTPPNSGSEHPPLTNEVPVAPIAREAAPTAVRDSEVKPAADGRPPVAHQRREGKTTPAEDTSVSPLEQLDLETLLKQYQKLQQNFATKRSASVSPLSLALEQPAHSPLKQEIMDSHTTTASSGVNPPPDSLLFMDVSPPSSTSSFGLLERRSGVGESEAGPAAAGKGDPSKLPPLHFSTPHEVEGPPHVFSTAAARATHTEDVTERILTLEERQLTRFRSESTSSVKPTPIGGRTTTPQDSAAREGMSSASRPHASSSPLTIRRGVSEDEHAMIPPQSPSPSPSRSSSCLSSSSGDVKGHPAASEEGLVRGSIFRSLYGPTQLGEAPDNLLPQPTIPEDKSAERQTKRRDHHGLEHQPAHHHRHHKKIKSTMAEQRSLVSPSLSMADESAETPSPLASSATTAPQSAERLPSRFSSDRVPYRVSLPSPASSSLEVAPPTAVKRSSPSPHRVVGLSSFTRGSSQSPLLGTALSFSPSGERAASVESPLHTDAAWTRSSASPSLPREDAVPGVYVAPSMSTLRSALSPPHADLRSHRAVSAVRGTTPASLPAPLRGSTEVPATRVTQRYVSPSPAPPTSRGTLLLEKVLQDEEELKQIRFTAASSPGRASRPLLLSPPMDVPPFTAAPAPSVSTSRGDHLTRPPHTHRTSLEKPPTEKTGGGHRTFGKYLCQYCGQLYGSSERCTVASAFTHRALRRRRRTQKEVKKAAQALLREGRVREAVELLQRYEIVVPSSFTGRGSRSVSRSAEAGGGAREGERARRHSQRLTLTPLTLERERERYRREAEEEERQGRASLPPPPSSSRPAQSPSEDRNRTTRMRTSTSPQSVLLYSNNRRVLDGPPLPLPPSHRS